MLHFDCNILKNLLQNKSLYGKKPHKSITKLPRFWIFLFLEVFQTINIFLSINFQRDICNILNSICF